MTETLEERCRRLEHFETPQWAIDAILQRVKLGGIVVDPAAGAGMLVEAAKKQQGTTSIWAHDIEDWGYPLDSVEDFLERTEPLSSKAMVFMNPPFKTADQFVRKAFELGAERVLCFQRLAWLESKKRKEFWSEYSPLRIYLCGERATCWRHDICPEERARRGDTPTPHAWFYFTRNSLSRGRPEFRVIYKDGSMI